MHRRNKEKELQEDTLKRTHGSSFHTDAREGHPRKKKEKSKGKPHCFHCSKQDYWAAACNDPEAEHCGQLHENYGTEK